MGRNYNILILFILSIIFISCNKVKEYPEDLPDYYAPLSEAVGEYVYIPHRNTEDGRDDYRYLNLKKGDTLKLKINKDSTFTFNYFYHDNAIKTENFNDKFSVSPADKDLLILKKYPDRSNYHGGTSGFKKGEKIYFYLRLQSPSDSTEYEYTLYYKKIR